MTGPSRLTAADVLRRYKEEDLPEFCDRELNDVNQGLFEDYPLHVAATRGELDEMTALLDGGAFVNARGEHGHTPLLSAVGQGHFEAVRLLLKHGALPTAKNDWGSTCSTLHGSSGKREILTLLDDWVEPSEPNPEAK